MSIENTEVANFVLNCIDINASNTITDYPFTNEVGSINDIRTDITWYNINLRNIIGETLYNKYELFNIKLSAVAYPQLATSFGLFPNDRYVSFYVSGFNWINNTYNTIEQTSNAEAFLGNSILLVNAPDSQTFNNSYLATFSKTEMVNIRIRYFNVLQIPTRPASPATLFPRMIFLFTIIPITKFQFPLIKSIENCQVANFTLSCTDISDSDSSASYPISNNRGAINDIRTDMTWFNINLRNIFGDYLYNKYEVFNIRLNSVTQPNIATFGLFANDRCISLYMSGLGWLNNSYDSLGYTNVDEAFIGNIILITDPNIITFNNSYIATFSKSTTANIRIRYINVLNIPSRPNASNTLFPRVTFNFSIIPVR